MKTISDEVKERRWKWISHVLRKDDNCHCMTVLTWAPEGRNSGERKKCIGVEILGSSQANSQRQGALEEESCCLMSHRARRG